MIYEIHTQRQLFKFDQFDSFTHALASFINTTKDNIEHELDKMVRDSIDARRDKRGRLQGQVIQLDSWVENNEYINLSVRP